MIIGFAAIKGAPGVTSTALAVAAAWPRPSVLIEADTAGGDLAYRARAKSGGPMVPGRGLVQLAAAVRSGGEPTGQEVTAQTQLLGCGVEVVQGVPSSSAARGLRSLWPTIAAACEQAELDVLVDLGRVDRGSAVMPLAQRLDALVIVTTAALDSVMHLVEGVADLAGPLAAEAPVAIQPLIVGPDTYAPADRADLDKLLQDRGMPTLPTLSMPYDPKALTRLERGESPDGRLGKTLLLRSAAQVAKSLAAGQPHEIVGGEPK